MQMSSTPVMTPSPLMASQSDSNNNHQTSASLSLGFLSLPPSSSAPPSSHHHHHQQQQQQSHSNSNRSPTLIYSDHQHQNQNHYQHQNQNVPNVILQKAIATAHPINEIPMPVVTPVARVRLSDIMAYDGAPGVMYSRSVEALSGSLMRHNAVVIELGSDDAALIRCGLESARLYFRTRAQNGGGGVTGGAGNWVKPSKGVYMYRAGRAFEDGDSSPPCMADVFRCMGKAARAALCAIARHLRLRSDVFNHLLDDTPLSANEVSSSVLVAASSHTSLQNGKSAFGGGKPSMNNEIEKGLLTLIASDSPGIQVCDPNSRWYLADGGSSPGDLLLLTGKALSHATAGLRPAASYRAATDYSSSSSSNGRASLAFRLMPQSNAILDCSPIAKAGHVTPQSYVPISVSQFMDDLSAEEDVACNHPVNNYEVQRNSTKDPSLRSVLSDPLSGAFLEDAVVVSCGHSFGGLMLRKVLEACRCSLCNAEIDSGSLIPNHALRAAAAAVKHEDDRRLFHSAALRKRRKEVGENVDTVKRLNMENVEMSTESDGQMHHRGVQYPFSVNEKVVIKGNKRTPDKFVGREAVITTQCLNGWYRLQILGSGESVRLQYRSLQKILSSQAAEDRRPSQSMIPNSS
ncbi:hypothetical protein C5167_033296 [Papaver somniferum]|uniref:PUB 62/63 C-terminal domain-containing protein n=1 Tax=Papaver somniferum TaxID=3469 RepID=A0A4Y7KDU7_PAPSO|nr:uncharacterized protein LOC113298266 [Papaver somniferum]RZC70139.1 hypothetical protein C5167_033296 [Papaver somniferum]